MSYATRGIWAMVVGLTLGVVYFFVIRGITIPPEASFGEYKIPVLTSKTITGKNYEPRNFMTMNLEQLEKLASSSGNSISVVPRTVITVISESGRLYLDYYLTHEGILCRATHAIAAPLKMQSVLWSVSPANVKLQADSGLLSTWWQAERSGDCLFIFTGFPAILIWLGVGFAFYHGTKRWERGRLKKAIVGAR